MVFACYSPTEATLGDFSELPSSESLKNLPVSRYWHFKTTLHEARLRPCDNANPHCQPLSSGWHLPLHCNFPPTHIEASASTLIISWASYIFISLTSLHTPSLNFEVFLCVVFFFFYKIIELVLLCDGTKWQLDVMISVCSSLSALYWLFLSSSDEHTPF